MEDLSQRQIEILRTIIQEYSESGEPVGSVILEKKFKLGFSPATIRNEMVELAKKGYIKKSHFSSGRIPSAKGFRFYIRHLMKEKELSTLDEVAYKNSIWDERTQVHRLLSHATKYLAQKTNLLAVSATESGDIYYAGVSNLLSQDEFLDLDLSKNVFGLLDETAHWESIMRQLLRMNEDILYMLGEEDFQSPAFEACASIFGEFEGISTKGIIGVIGPKRMSYEVIIPQVRYFSNLIEEILKTQNL